LPGIVEDIAINTHTRQNKIRILGIDPGSLKTGFGVIDVQSGKYRYVTSGIIRIASRPLPERLAIISTGIQQIVEEYGPQVAAVEDVFFARDPRAALKLGQARGAAITASVIHGLSVNEYAPRLVKQSVVGTGAASKDQVQFMVKKMLNLNGELKEDAADALAVAICHANHLGSVAS
jgi:crossover junction endodeoxyribonuclease RuvC